MTRTTITTDHAGDVVVNYEDGSTRIFTCPKTGGYVRELVRNHYGFSEHGPSVCKGLRNRGTVLSAASRADLLAIIRRENRRLKARAEA